MKKLNLEKVLILTMIAVISLFTSCRKDIDITHKGNSSETFSIIDNEIRLGKELKNPYTVENMKKAYDNLIIQGKIFKSNIDIQTTHYYIRYLPKSEEELQVLKKDSTLELFDYPLDYEILSEGGTYYHDASLPDSINWQYCVVDKDYQFENIEYEILANLFIPELLGEGNKKYQVLDNVLIKELVDEAFRITGNSNEETKQESSIKRWSKWTPDGYIKVYDDIKKGLIPLEGAKVRARRWFIIKVGYTNSAGYFSTGQFRRPVNYSIKWENSEYDIRNAWSIQVYFNGPKQRSRWNLNINSGKSLRYATIHRAAYRYHHKNIGGLKRPNVWRRLKINYIDNSGTGVNWGNNWQMFVPGSVLWPNIKIWGKDDNGNYWPTNELFSTTIHELGHASHIELMNAGLIQFGQVTVQIRESWANAIEWYITKIEYNELGFTNYDNPNIYPFNYKGDNMQWWSSSYNHNYTPIFIDLVDNYNQALNKGNQPTNKCPNGGIFDGSNCYIGTPPNGETAFIYADNFYYTPVGCCDCPQSGTWYDGANCFKMDIPNNSIGFIWNNSWYLHPAGNSSYPYDQVSGYTMHNIENLLKHVYGLSSLQTKLKANKPSGMTDKHINVYLNYFFNL